jgi:hypothetical protein
VSTSPPVNTLPPVSPPVGLSITVTTNHSHYALGQNVQMSVTATNNTNHNITVWVGPNSNVFTITRNGKVVWRSNSGPQPLYPSVAKVIAPGQSLTLTAVWKAALNGTFVVSNQMAPSGPTATFTVGPVLPPVNPPGGGGNLPPTGVA